MNTTNTTDWTREEFEAYLLFYCANADFVETEEEKKLIHSKVSDNAYNKMHAEFEADNDYQSIQKIIHTAERFELSKNELDGLFQEINQVFLSDGKMDMMEREIFIGLKRILK